MGFWICLAIHFVLFNHCILFHCSTTKIFAYWTKDPGPSGLVFPNEEPCLLFMLSTSLMHLSYHILPFHSRWIHWNLKSWWLKLWILFGIHHLFLIAINTTLIHILILLKTQDHFNHCYTDFCAPRLFPPSHSTQGIKVIHLACKYYCFLILPVSNRELQRSLSKRKFIITSVA